MQGTELVLRPKLERVELVTEAIFTLALLSLVPRIELVLFNRWCGQLDRRVATLGVCLKLYRVLLLVEVVKVLLSLNQDVIRLATVFKVSPLFQHSHGQLEYHVDLCFKDYSR